MDKLKSAMGSFSSKIRIASIRKLPQFSFSKKEKSEVDFSASLQDLSFNQSLQSCSGFSFRRKRRLNQEADSYYQDFTFATKRSRISPDSFDCDEMATPVNNKTGQLKLTVTANNGLLTVHVIQARHLSSRWGTTCDAFVKVSLVPEASRRCRCKTHIVQDSNHPVFDEKFTFETAEADLDKRLYVSVWNKDSTKNCNEFLGCMSFGVRKLQHSLKTACGWYYLLAEEVGRRKQLQAVSSRKGVLRERAPSNKVIVASKDITETETFTAVVKRGKSGFGFTIRGCGPVRVTRVEQDSDAELVGVQRGDVITKINGQNVQTATAEQVADIIKISEKKIVIDLKRTCPLNRMSPLPRRLSSTPVNTQKWGAVQDLIVEEPCQEFMLNNETITSWPETTLTVEDSSQSEHERVVAAQRLMQCEEEFVHIMQSGIQRFSRPLRHRFLSPQEHRAIFQNLEKLVALSYFHLKQLQENSIIYTERDLNQYAFTDSVGAIYQSKLRLVCEAYKTYCEGLQSANQLLARLRGNYHLDSFLMDASAESDDMDVHMFIERPLQHLRTVQRHLQVILSHTAQEHHDLDSLLEVVDAIQDSCGAFLSDSQQRRATGASSVVTRSSCNSGTGHRAPSSSASSVCSSGSVDSELVDLQGRLQFADNIKAFQLAAPSRHMIYAAELLHYQDRWNKVWVVLCSDLLLMTQKDASGQMVVIDNPIYFSDITATDFDCEHPSEFNIETDAMNTSQCSLEMSGVTLRAPTMEQKFVWKSLLQHRITISEQQVQANQSNETKESCKRLGSFIEDFGFL